MNYYDKMTVSELIEALKNYPPDARVVVLGYESGYDDITLIKQVAILPEDKYLPGSMAAMMMPRLNRPLQQKRLCCCMAGMRRNSGMALEPIQQDYLDFLTQIKTRIRQRQYQALRAVNTELVMLYWELGEAIERKQQEQGWGKSVVKNLARDLQSEFPGRNGFSAQNLWLMRQFFKEYRDKEKLQPLVRELSWAKNLVIMSRCKDNLEREFYLRATARFGWTKKRLAAPDRQQELRKIPAQPDQL